MTFAPTFLYKFERTHFVAPPFRLRPALLGSQLAGCPAGGFFTFIQNIGFNRPLQNRKPHKLALQAGLRVLFCF